ncbi:MAG: efflux RND transporter periplasmic adaptor subunit, partial [Candidatus Sumerlaeia bacterium]|nr:efflux RND transporter periplasmic adaptor subunit [Candidatus Sumerlaeia bacterium]
IGCGKKQDDSKLLNNNAEAIPVEIFKAVRTTLQNEMTFTGTVAAIDEVTIQPKVSGEVLKLYVDKGAEVTAGDLLAELDTRDFLIRLEDAEAAVKVAQAQIAATRAELDQVTSDYKRLEELNRQEIISAQQFESIKSKLRALEAQLKLAESQLERATALRNESQLQLSYTRIVSPIDGIITERFVSAGEIASPGKPLFKIVNLDPIKVVTHIPETILPNLKLGQLAVISAEIDKRREFTGKIQVIGPAVDPLTRTAGIEILTSNSLHLLKPGMFCRTRLIVEERQKALAVPREAISREGNITYVFTIDSDVANRRNIKIGIEQGGLVEVLEGITEGELVVVSGKENLRTGSRVKIARVLEASERQ